MTEFPTTQDEASLQAMLYDLEILNSPPESDFDQIAMLAQLLCEAPIALIGFTAPDHVWFKSRLGLNAGIDGALPLFFKGLSEPAVVEDVNTDPRTKGHILIDTTGITSMIVVPVLGSNGISIGHITVADTRSRTFTPAQIQGLELLAIQVMNLLKLRKLKWESNQHAALNNEGLQEIEKIFENAVDAVFILDENGSISSWNPRAVEIFGWTAEEAIGQEYYVLILPEYAHANFFKKREQYVVEGLPKQAFEIIAKRKDESEFTASLGVSPTYVNGQLHFILFIRELIDRKLNQELGKQKSFYENILNKIPTDIAVFDVNHRYVFANPWAIKNEALRKKIIGMDDFEYAAFRNRDFTVARKRREQFLEAKQTGKVVKWEDSMKNPEGQTITHLRRIFPIADDEGKISMFIGFGIDITERKQLEEKQSVMMKQLSAQNTQLLDFCNIVSHNLRGPLINMAMLVEFIEDSNDLDEIKILTSKLNPVIESLNTTFNELVESIQVRQDLEVESERIVLQEYLQRTLDGLEMEINKTGAVFKVNFEDAPMVNYPPKYLNSIFHNLVSNALKYRSPERPPIIEISTRKNKDSVLLVVKDNGLGIDLTKHKDNIFKIGKVFHKHPNAKGLGLYMTKTQIEAMNGKIWVESAPDAGAVFYIVFSNQH
jgi:PAS domain S-box-containing protein